MKKTFLFIATATLIFGIALTSCYTSSEKVDNAQDNVAEANKDLDEANQEYLADIEAYKKEANDKIAANNKSIAEFNDRIAKKKLSANNEYNKKIAKLDQQNSDMKKKIDDYQAVGKSQWEQFKEEFSRDMETLGQAFKDLTENNSK